MTSLSISKKWLLLGALLVTTVLGGGSLASASEKFETVDVRGGYFQISDGETKTLALDGWKNVRKLFIQAEGIRRDGTFEVVVNGDVKGTVYVPGRDPSYVVTIAEAANSIQFRHVSGGRIQVRDVQATVSVQTYHYRDPCAWDCSESALSLRARNQASALAYQAIRIVDELQGYANHKDYGTYLLPVKKAAARAYATAQARGSLSGKVRKKLFSLLASLNLSRPYIEDTFERAHAFELAVKLLALREKIEDSLN